MNDLDRFVRVRSERTRAVVADAIDVDDALAATLRRPAGADAALPPETANRVAWLAIAAAVVAFAIIGVAVSSRTGQIRSIDPVASVETTAATTEPTVTPSTVPPSTSAAPTTAPATAPATPEARALVDYLDALAARRYDDAAPLLVSGAINDDRRRDLLPLLRDDPGAVDQYGTIIDLAGALEAWCEGPAVCVPPSELLPDGDHRWIAVYDLGSGVSARAYFSTSIYEGRPEIRGLPPRRPVGAAIACPGDRVVEATEADLDGDGAVENIVLTAAESPGTVVVHVCNTATEAEPLAVDLGDSATVVIVDHGAGTADELLVGTSNDALAVRRLELAGNLLVGLDTAPYVMHHPPAVADVAERWSSFGCEPIDGADRLVAYSYRLVGGDTIDTATAVEVDVLASPADSPADAIAHHTFELPAQIDAANRLLDPRCGGRPLLVTG